jgi:hypothetical protein
MNAILKSITAPLAVDTLVAQWVEHKRQEEQANKRRVELEAQIIAVLGEPDEGSATHELVDGSKLTITSKITRTVDEAAWRSIMADIPEQMRPISFAERAVLDLKGLRWLMDHEPRIYNRVAAAVTAKKAKSALSLKVA